ncbi:MAG: hypothetical protein ACFFG0_29945, partial [Candidatus Thorarchaeota archaeon]
TVTLATEFGTIFNGTGNGVGNPSIAIDSKGNLHVVYIKWSNNDLNNQSIMYTVKNAKTNKWSTAQVLTKFEYSFIPSPISIAIDSKDDWHIVFPDRDSYKNQSETRYVKYMNKTTTVTLAKEFGTQFTRTGNGVGHPSIDIDSKGNLHVVYIKWSWLDWDNQSIMYTIKNSISNKWSTAKELTKFEYSFIPSPVSIAISPNDDWNIVFPDRVRYKNESEIRYVKYMNKTTTVTLAMEFGTQFIIRSGKGVGHPSIDIDSRGNIHVLYIQWSWDDWNNQSIMYLTNNNQTPAINKLDIDLDNLPDAWEIKYFGNLNQKADDDFDNDGYTNLQEFLLGTEPNNKDSDDDGVLDPIDKFPLDDTQWKDTDGDGYGDELDGNNPDLFPYDPNEWSDMDRDGIGDNSDPYPYDPDRPGSTLDLVDSDGDGLPNIWEIQFGLDPLNSSDAKLDLDNDSLSNIDEYKLGTDPTKYDTDGDGYSDKEDAYPLNPEKHLKEVGDDSIDFNFIIILIIVYLIVMFLIILRFIIVKRKRPHEKEDPKNLEDQVYRNLINEIQYDKIDTKLSDDEFKRIMEEKYQKGEMSKDTYVYMKDFIEKENIGK